MRMRRLLLPPALRSGSQIADIDWDNPITAGLERAWTFQTGNTATEHVGRTQAALSGTSVGADGFLYSNTGTVASAISGTASIKGTVTGTIILPWRFIASDNATQLRLFQRDGGNDGSGYGFYLNGPDYDFHRRYYLTGWENYQGPAGVAAGSDTAIGYGYRWVALVVTRSGGNSTFRLRDRDAGTLYGATVAVAAQSFGSSIQFGARAGYTALGEPLIWNRALSDAEIDSIFADRDQVFARRKIWVPVGGVAAVSAVCLAGGTLTSKTASSPGDAKLYLDANGGLVAASTQPPSTRRVALVGGVLIAS